MKHAYLISCSDHYGHRMGDWDRALQAFGIPATYLTSDFSHTAKETYSCTVPGCVQLHVRPYRKNLSADRILSHREFAIQVRRWLEALPDEPIVLVCLLPPNFLARELKRYKRRHPQVRLIFDLFDLWPETFPSSRMKRLLSLPFRIWADLRDRNLDAADFVTAECSLYREILSLDGSRSGTIYFSLPPYEGPEFPAVLPKDRAELAYLGAINNLIDIPRIAAFLRALSARMPVRLHIIGEGETRAAFCEAARAAGAEVEFHGEIFGEAEKHRILSGCHFGLNVMKDSVCVGLTMKSVDYLRHGLPIISTIGGDTAALLASRSIGLSLRDPERTAAAAADLISAGTGDFSRAACETYEALFSSHTAEASCISVLRRVLASAGEAL